MEGGRLCKKETKFRIESIYTKQGPINLHRRHHLSGRSLVQNGSLFLAGVPTSIFLIVESHSLAQLSGSEHLSAMDCSAFC